MAVDLAALNALTRQFGVDRANLDDEQNRLKTNYRQVLDNLKDTSQQGFGNLSVGMADQGLTHSGIAVQEGTRLANSYNNAGAQAGNTMALNLATIARKRLEQEAEFNAQRGLL